MCIIGREREKTLCRKFPKIPSSWKSFDNCSGRQQSQQSCILWLLRQCEQSSVLLWWSEQPEQYLPTPVSEYRQWVWLLIAPGNTGLHRTRARLVSSSWFMLLMCWNILLASGGICLEPLMIWLQLNKQETLNTSRPTLKPTHHKGRLEFIPLVWKTSGVSKYYISPIGPIGDLS